jgi:catechol-2,3-dioxygenase
LTLEPLEERITALASDKTPLQQSFHTRPAKSSSPLYKASVLEGVEAMNFLGISWAGLYASDLTALAGFYAESVGLPIVEQGDGYCLLDVGGGAVFELWADGSSVPHRKTPKEQSVIIAFAVPSLESAMKVLSSRGLHPDSEVGSYRDSRWVYYTDPEGNRFELKETH